MSSPAPSEPIPPPTPHHHTRPLDAMAAAIVVVLCLSWGFNQVAVKLAIHDIPPLMQGAIRSGVATLLVAGWCTLRGIPLFNSDSDAQARTDGRLLLRHRVRADLSGARLHHRHARGSLSLSCAVLRRLGARIFLPADKFSLWQWLGLALSFAGMMVAFGLPTPALDPRQTLGDIMMVVAAMFWAATTLTIKASKLNGTSPEKVMLYQLIVSAPMMALAAWIGGETMTHFPDHQSIAWLAYQTVWVVSVTFVIWFWIIKNYSANRVSAFSFLTPLFGVAAGHLVMGDPLTLAFIAAVALVAGGLMLVNRTK